MVQHYTCFRPRCYIYLLFKEPCPKSPAFRSALTLTCNVSRCDLLWGMTEKPKSATVTTTSTTMKTTITTTTTTTTTTTANNATNPTTPSPAAATTTAATTTTTTATATTAATSSYYHSYYGYCYFRFGTCSSYLHALTYACCRSSNPSKTLAWQQWPFRARQSLGPGPTMALMIMSSYPGSPVT